jgi:peptidoglycan hydrolase-like protein with peptidoglycan-binding domain
VTSFRAVISFTLAVVLASVPALASRPHHPAATTASSHTRSTHRLASHTKGRSHKLHGQQAIDSERVTQIQQALIRQHYLTGEANGEWDATTQAAMQKYQSDQGWQTKLMPDSRALKKLGLGPDYSTAINAKDSSFAAPAPASTIPSQQASGFAAAAGVNK